MYAKLEEDCKDDSEEVVRVKRALLKRLLIAETIESGCADMSEVSLNEYGSYTRPIGPDYEWPGGESRPCPPRRALAWLISFSSPISRFSNAGNVPS
jgi:hypothetical protein